jgi:hypothetical protein
MLVGDKEILSLLYYFVEGQGAKHPRCGKILHHVGQYLTSPDPKWRY